MEGDPHQLLEGMILAAYAIGASHAYIFLRWAYREAEQILRRAIGEAEQAGLLGENILGSGFDLDLHIHVSAGRYMCGEETGLLNALEGRRATPRAKPPYPQVSGLWGRPTIVQNVETLCNVPHIVARGAEWFKAISNSTDGGTKIYGVSGRVRRPGAWELPLGTTAREVIEEHAGGMEEGLELRGFLPGGASTDFLTPEHLDVHLDFDSVSEGRQPAGHRHHDPGRQRSLPGLRHGRAGALLRPRVVRLVHPLPGRPALGGEDADGDRGRLRPAGGPRAPRDALRGCSAPATPSAPWRPGRSRRSARRSASSATSSSATSSRAAVRTRRAARGAERDSPGRRPASPGPAGRCGHEHDEHDQRDQHDLGRRDALRGAEGAGRPGREPAPRLPLPRARPALLLLASGHGLGRRLPPVRGQAVQGRGRRAGQDRHGLHDRGRGRHPHRHRGPGRPRFPRPGRSSG